MAGFDWNGWPTCNGMGGRFGLEYAATKQIAYLNELELPFFVGVVSESELSLRVYSCENLSYMQSLVGRIEKLTVTPVEEIPSVPFEPYVVRRKEYTVFFPKITEIKANASLDDLSASSSTLYEMCNLSLNNIATRRNKEYICQDRLGNVLIIAGSGSAKTFRENFCRRLAECFYNLVWLSKNQWCGSSELAAELTIYENLYKTIQQHQEFYGKLPGYLVQAYGDAKAEVNTKI